MQIREIETTYKHNYNQCVKESEVTERTYQVKDRDGFPIGKVTVKKRLITLEAVGTVTFSQNVPSHVELIEKIFGGDEEFC